MASSAFRLLYFSPDPEYAERVCVGLLFAGDRATQVVYDPRFQRLRCLSKSLDVSLVQQYLDDLRSRLRGAGRAESESVLNRYQPQLTASEPYRVISELSPAMQQRLLDRFTSSEEKDARKESREAAARQLEPFARDLNTFLSRIAPSRLSASSVLRLAKPLDIFGINAKIAPVAMAIVDERDATLLDGVDLNSPKGAALRVGRVVHTFWRYGQLRDQGGLAPRLNGAMRLHRVAVILSSGREHDRRVAEAHKYATHLFSAEADLTVDEESGKGVAELQELLMARTGGFGRAPN